MSKVKTVAASFTFVYADLVPVHGRKLRLFRNMSGNLPDQYIKACRLSTANVIERSNGRDPYQHANAAEYPVALIGGNMLDADNGIFWVAYFGIDTNKHAGSGYRYCGYKGLAAAEAAVERWAKRKFRVPAEVFTPADPYEGHTCDCLSDGCQFCINPDGTPLERFDQGAQAAAKRIANTLA